MEQLFSLAILAADRAAVLLRSNYQEDAGIENDHGKDIKTKADLAAQEEILDVLGSTSIPVLAEEGEQNLVDLDERIWLVDPLDGTWNFWRGFPVAAVSIALWENGRPLLGVVQDVFNGQVFSALVGEAAWLDDQAIRVSTVSTLDQAVLATGFPSGRKYDTDSLLNFVNNVQQFKKIRMLGSAALMLCQVASGRFDVYEEEDIFLWDVAAGLALVQAAGGSFSLAPGSGPYKYVVRAGNGRL